MRLFRLSRLAESDLDEAWLFVSQQSGTSRADGLLVAIEEAFRLLLDFPDAGRKRDDLGDGLRSLPVATFLVVYRPTGVVIEIVRVVHGARDMGSLFGSDL